jgi:hypothetical protein
MQKTAITLSPAPNLADNKGLPENKIPSKKIEKCFFKKIIIFVQENKESPITTHFSEKIGSINFYTSELFRV